VATEIDELDARSGEFASELFLVSLPVTVTGKTFSMPGAMACAKIIGIEVFDCFCSLLICVGFEMGVSLISAVGSYTVVSDSSEINFGVTSGTISSC
jgi:hypothetical protein